MANQRNMFHGSLVALVTPMNVDGTIDFSTLRTLIDWHIESSSHGLVLMGTTGEAPLMSIEETVAVIQAALQHANHRIRIIAGCGSASTEKSIALVEAINPLKPDGFLCVTPYYVKPTQEGLKQHFLAVADACDVPLLLYNVPSRTGCDLSNEVVIELASHGRIVGLKDATGDLSRVKFLRKKLTNDFCLLSGDDATAFEFMLNGGDGVITVSGNLAPKKTRDWCELLLADATVNKKAAKQIFENLAPLYEALFIESNPIPVKWALAQMNRITASIRLPLTQPQIQTQIEITRALKLSVISESVE